MLTKNNAYEREDANILLYVKESGKYPQAVAFLMRLFRRQISQAPQGRRILILLSRNDTCFSACLFCQGRQPAWRIMRVE
jgi:hypothetical protein